MSTIHSSHSLQSVTPLINRLVDDLLVKILPTGAQSVLEIVQIENRNAIHALLQSPPPKQRSQPGSSPGCWGHTDGSMKHGTLQELDGRLHSIRRRAVLLKHEMIVGLLSSDEFLGDDIVAAEFLWSSLIASILVLFLIK